MSVSDRQLVDLPIGSTFQTKATNRVGIRESWPDDWVAEPGPDGAGTEFDVVVYFEDGEPRRVRSGLVVLAGEPVVVEGVL